jgi:hypothetical protein
VEKWLEMIRNVRCLTVRNTAELDIDTESLRFVLSRGTNVNMNIVAK